MRFHCPKTYLNVQQMTQPPASGDIDLFAVLSQRGGDNRRGASQTVSVIVNDGAT
jgi:hypothetical protein